MNINYILKKSFLKELSKMNLNRSNKKDKIIISSIKKR